MPSPAHLRFPDKETEPEAYAARIAAMAAGRARAKAKRKPSKRAASVAGIEKTTPPSKVMPHQYTAEELGVVDVGTPSPVAMGGDPVKPAERKRQRKEEFDAEDVGKHVGMVFAMLGSIPGHEHWQREPDEVALISEPATRCLNRLDPELRSRVRELSDPAALVIACCWVIGPSLVKEIADARNGRKQPGNSGGSYQPQAEARNGAGSTPQGVPTAAPAGAAPVPPTGFGIPPLG